MSAWNCKIKFLAKLIYQKIVQREKNYPNFVKFNLKPYSLKKNCPNSYKLIPLIIYAKNF